MERDVMAIGGGKTLTIFLAADLKKFNSGLNDARGSMSKFGGSINDVLGPALIGAGIAAGALATKLAIDGVKAAIEDEAAMARLATTMQNLGLAHDIQPVEDYIYQLERSLGIADSVRAGSDRLPKVMIGKSKKVLSGGASSTMVRYPSDSGDRKNSFAPFEKTDWIQRVKAYQKPALEEWGRAVDRVVNKWSVM